jgi:hypothetical protein
LIGTRFPQPSPGRNSCRAGWPGIIPTGQAPQFPIFPRADRSTQQIRSAYAASQVSQVSSLNLSFSRICEKHHRPNDQLDRYRSILQVSSVMSEPPRNEYPTTKRNGQHPPRRPSQRRSAAAHVSSIHPLPKRASRSEIDNSALASSPPLLAGLDF